MKRVLKGIGKLISAAALTACVGILAFSVEAKAATAAVAYGTDAQDGLKYTVSNQDGADDIVKIEVKVGGTVVYTTSTASDFTNGDHSVPAATILSGAASKSAEGAITLSYTLNDASATVATASGTTSEKIITVKGTAGVKYGPSSTKNLYYDLSTDTSSSVTISGNTAYCFYGAPSTGDIKVSLTAKFDPAGGYYITGWNSATGTMSGADNQIFTVSDPTTSQNYGPLTSEIKAKIDHIKYDPSDMTLLGNSQDKVFGIKLVDVDGQETNYAGTFSHKSDSGITGYNIAYAGTNLTLNALGTGTLVTKYIPTSAEKFLDTSESPLLGTFTVVAAPNALTLTPANPTVYVGGSSVTFTATPNVGTPSNYTYKWYKGTAGSPTLISGATGYQYTLAAPGTLPSPTTEQIKVEVMNGASVLASATTTVTYASPAAFSGITYEPSTIDVTKGETITVKAKYNSPSSISTTDVTFTSSDTGIFTIESATKDVANGCYILKIKGEKAGTSAKLKAVISGTNTTAASDQSVRVYARPSITYNDSSRTLTLCVPEKIMVGTSENLTDVTGFKLQGIKNGNVVYDSDTKYYSSGTGEKVTVSASDVEGIVTAMAAKTAFSGETDSLQFRLIAVGHRSGDSSNYYVAKKADGSDLYETTNTVAVYNVAITPDSGVYATATPSYGLKGQTITLTASAPGYDSSKITWKGLYGSPSLKSTTGATTTLTVSDVTANNKVSAVLGERTTNSSTDTAAGGTGASKNDTGRDNVPKTAESNAPIFLIIVLVFAAMGGGYALYLQMRPATATSSKKKSNKHKY